MADSGAVLEDELALAREITRQRETLVLVEGNSDRRAVQTLATRMGVDGMSVVALAGATNIRRFLALAEPSRTFALCDDLEEAMFATAFHSHGVPLSHLFVCTPDLEGAMIDALGTDTVLDLVDAAGESNVFDRMRAQPAQRDRSLYDQLHRFIGTRSGRKIRYAALTAQAVDLERLPEGIGPLIGHLQILQS